MEQDDTGNSLLWPRNCYCGKVIKPQIQGLKVDYAILANSVILALTHSCWNRRRKPERPSQMSVQSQAKPKKFRIIKAVVLICFFLILFIPFLVAAGLTLSPAISEYPDYSQSLGSIEYNGSSVQARDNSGKLVDLTIPYKEHIPPLFDTFGYIVAVVDIRQFQVSDQTASLHLQICVNKYDPLHPSKLNDFLYDKNGKLKKENIDITITGFSRYFSDFSVPVGQLQCDPKNALYTETPFSRTPPPGFITDVVVPTLSHPELYPFDYYKVALQFFIPLGDGSIPTLVIKESSLADKNVERLDLCRQDDNPYEVGCNSFEVVITRNRAAWLYVIPLAVTPLIVALIAMFLVFDRSKGKEEPDVQGLILGLFAAFLTILPLRPILVPSDITTLTIVDFILGFDMMLIVAAGVGMYINMLLKKKENVIYD